MAHSPEAVQTQKFAMRREAESRRAAFPARDAASAAIWARFLTLPEYVAARAVMLYVDFGNEVRTQPHLPRLFADGKRVVVPYCVGDELRLFCLERIDEIAPGRFGVLEPRAELRGDPQKSVLPSELDLVMTPGVAFDRRGGRLGHGRGFYDRLLRQLRPKALVVGVAFECQLFDEVPMTATDVFVDRVATEAAVYMGQGRAGSQCSDSTKPR
jgi:5-formyltetrahydrofolate cyclo-ligase